MTGSLHHRLFILKAYLKILGAFVLFWWPLSHWFYPEWYHRLMGFEDFDPALVIIIGTTGMVVVMNIFAAACDPIRNRAAIAILITFSILMAWTYFFLIRTHGFPVREYFNIALLIVNAIILTALYPREEYYPDVTEHRAGPADHGRVSAHTNEESGPKRVDRTSDTRIDLAARGPFRRMQFVPAFGNDIDTTGE